MLQKREDATENQPGENYISRTIFVFFIIKTWSYLCVALVTTIIKEGYGVLLAFNVMKILDEIGESGSVHQQRQRSHVRHQRLLYVMEMRPELRTIRSHLDDNPESQSRDIKKLSPRIFYGKLKTIDNQKGAY